MNIELLLKIRIKQIEKTSYMSRKNSYIGISFIILIFGIYVVRNLDDRISNETLIDNNRLNSTQKNNEDNLSQLFVYDKVQCAVRTFPVSFDSQWTKLKGSVSLQKVLEH